MKDLDLDLIETLKNCPKGTKLYSPIYGEVIFDSINDDCNHPIVIRVDNDHCDSFTKGGKYCASCPNGECTLFPSKEQRDWSKFKIPKPDLPIDTPVMATNSIYEGWFLRYYAGNGKVYFGGDKSANCTECLHWRYIIPFDKFDPNDIEGSIEKYNYGTDQ